MSRGNAVDRRHWLDSGALRRTHGGKRLRSMTEPGQKVKPNGDMGPIRLCNYRSAERNLRSGRP